MQPPRAGPKLPKKIKRQRRLTDAVYSFSDTITSNLRDLEFIIQEIRNCKCTGRRGRGGEWAWMYQNLLRMVSKGEGNPGPRVTLARGSRYSG